MKAGGYDLIRLNRFRSNRIPFCRIFMIEANFFKPDIDLYIL